MRYFLLFIGLTAAWLIPAGDGASLQHHPTCGNGLVDPGEDCDCGPSHSCKDPCCVPSDSIDARPCSLYIGALCSSSQPCCDVSTCQPADTNVQCGDSTNCRAKSFCDGVNPTCPIGVPTRDNLPCNHRSGICSNGTCMSPCVLQNLSPCSCTSPGDSCKTCCLSFSQICRPARYFGILADSKSDFVKPVGSPCENGRGWCTPHSGCTTKSFLAAPIPARSNWISRNWKYILVFLLLTVLVVVVLALVCLVLKDRHASTPTGDTVYIDSGDGFSRHQGLLGWGENQILFGNTTNLKGSQQKATSVDTRPHEHSTDVQHPGYDPASEHPLHGDSSAT